MRLSCLQENLARGLSVVGRAVASRSTLPITQNVLLSTEQSMLKISATDLNMAMTTWIGAQVEEEGAITVPARLLGDFVNSLPPERIDIETTAQPIGLNIKCVSFESNISGTPADDFPPIPAVADGVAAKIEPNVLREAIDRVSFAAAVEDSRPVLTGVKTEITGSDFKFAAADGFRLAVYSGKLAEPPSEDIEFLIPARVLNEISRLLGTQQRAVEFMVTPSSNQALFRVEDVEIVSSLIAGNFPNYNQLIPQSHTTRVVIDSDDFLRATRIAAIFARDGNGIIRLQVAGGEEEEPGRLTISSRSEEVGDNEGQLGAAVEGEEAKIAFNTQYLTDVLEVINGDVAMEVSSPSSPGVIKPAEGDDYVHVVMPMYVQW
ncbi:MAG: DNA polymerase III subunit beta [Chloroflexota bacterium]|nr:DNA polymerase III subunit beta [Chloroflexota bacterium]